MLNFSFGELTLTLIIGLIILGPKKLVITIQSTQCLIKIFNNLLTTIKYKIISLIRSNLRENIGMIQNDKNHWEFKINNILEEINNIKYLIIKNCTNKNDIERLNFSISSIKIFENINRIIYKLSTIIHKINKKSINFNKKILSEFQNLTYKNKNISSYKNDSFDKSDKR
ncbi:hypothetical protein [Candidatus Pantoea edessiphila]|uniref:Sec-independent protein translocase protein TatB n=1 Tax=Candidatus Pantoea edessiphila TaxID=2044610 RepID=A0A2P5SVC0_9GAMM|nr:hypothetical protein [Candidatus Pantoea edessiphila]PPI86272.1 hypothetical protein CRV10_03400 [Candidatus Pantoea edessiphila]